MDLFGLVTAVATPFKSDFTVDADAFVAHLEYLAECGCDTVLISGTTAEFFSLLPRERRFLLELAVDNFPGTVIFHATCDSLAFTMEEAKWAEEKGVDAIAALPPYYFADVEPSGVVRYFIRLGEFIRIPLILYNFPHHTQVPLSPEILEAVPHYALKDSSRSLSLIRHTPRYFVGGDRWIQQTHEQGGRGFVSGLSNALPRLFVAMERALRENDRASIETLQARISAAAELFSGGNAIARFKYAIARSVHGYPATVRVPLLPLSEEHRRAIDAFLDESGDLPTPQSPPTQPDVDRP